jgi:hypothetical protein
MQTPEAVPIWKDSADNRMSSYVRHRKYRGLLHSVAYRVLGDSDRADIAVENCLLAAFRDVRAFECEGAFRSWLVRSVIDEALAIIQGRPIPGHGATGSCAMLDSVTPLVEGIG